MNGKLLAEERMAAIEKAMIEFFSRGTLEDKVNQAHALGHMKGLDIFSTAVPWRVRFPNSNQEATSGFSETLYYAAKDIYSLLMVLKLYQATPPDTVLEISIR